MHNFRFLDGISISGIFLELQHFFKSLWYFLICSQKQPLKIFCQFNELKKKPAISHRLIILKNSYLRPNLISDSTVFSEESLFS